MVPSSTRVLIYAPFELNRSAWWALLSAQPGIAVIGAAACLDDLRAFQPAAPPLTLFVDSEHVQADFVQEISHVLPGCGLLFLVQESRLEEIVVLMKAGATGFVGRSQSTGDLSRAIIAAGRGEMVLPASIAMQSLLLLAGNEAAQSPVEPLTPRENDVLRLLAQGRTNKDIAQGLFLSVRTVEAHLRTIYGKIGVRSRTEAALWAVRQGYGETPEPASGQSL